jgi:hypothetical protein
MGRVVGREIAGAAKEGQQKHGNGMEGGLALGGRAVEMGSQERFQIAKVEQLQGDVERGEVGQGARILQGVEPQIAIVGAIARFGRGRDIRVKGKG